jgi:hypothetical protein
MLFVEDFTLPPPKTGDKLGDLICDLDRMIWSDRDTRRLGRSGQGQEGVGIIGTPDGGAGPTGVQVKLRTKRLTVGGAPRGARKRASISSGA